MLRTVHEGYYDEEETSQFTLSAEILAPLKGQDGKLICHHPPSPPEVKTLIQF